MRFKKRFKLIKLRRRSRVLDIPLKVLRFGNTGWNSIVEFLKNRKRLSYFFRLSRQNKSTKSKGQNLKYDFKLLKKSSGSDIIKRVGFTNMKLQASLKIWERLKDNYKESLNVRRGFYQTYESCVSYRELKKQLFLGGVCDKITFLRKILRFEFRIDILLYKLRFFKSSYEARVYLNKGLIRVNSRVVKGNCFVKSGDIITCDHVTSYKYNLDCLKKSFFLRNCFEIDFYTGTIIVLRSYNQIYESEIPYFFIKYFDWQKFRYSFR
jgi:ribosomal protein S4